MNSSLRMKRMLAYAGLAGAIICLSSCNKTNAPEPVTATPPASSDTSSAPHPSAHVTPQSSDTPAASGQTGPADGSTAIGGGVGNQEQGGAKQNQSTHPQPSGGDSAPQK